MSQSGLEYCDAAAHTPYQTISTVDDELSKLTEPLFASNQNF